MMEDELKKNAADLLSLLKDGLEKGTQMAGEQLPDLAMQYVLWGRVTHTVYFALFVTVAVVCAWAAYQSGVNNRWKVKDEYGSWGAARGATVVICGFVGFMSVLCVLMSASETLMVWFAPKVWLLKEIAQVLK